MNVFVDWRWWLIWDEINADIKKEFDSESATIKIFEDQSKIS